MKLNEVYILMNNLIRGNVNIDIDRKIMALNEGYKYLAIKFHELGSPLQELIVEPTNISNLADVNYVNLPENYFSLLKLYRKIDTNSYEPLYKDQIIPYERLVDISGPMFLDTTNTGIITMAAIKEPKIFFDVYFDAIGTDNIKISYDSLPDELVTYDEIEITNVSGTFVAGDTVEVVSDIINPTTSLATATILERTATTIKIQNRSGLFTKTLYAVVGDLTTPTYTAIGIISSDTEINPQVLEISAKYKMLLANAGALMYLYMEDDIEAEAKQKTLDEMINQVINMNISKENIKVRFYG